MADERHDIVGILLKYALRQPLDEDETLVLEEWRSRSAVHDALPDQFLDKRWVEEQRRQLHTPPTQEMWAEVRQYIEATRERPPAIPARRRVGYGSIALVASLIGLLVWGGVQWFRQEKEKAQVAAVAAMSAQPYKLLLTLDDGSRIDLDTLKKGANVVGEGFWLKKADTNCYVYFARGAIDASIRHRLMLAKGAAVCRIQWPDGSSAWVKPGTSIDYPVDLRAAEAKLDGEAWFRVAHDPGRPVTIGMPDGTRTRVLGTSFDIRSGDGAACSRVALFSGAVQVVKSEDSILLRPGSLAISGPKEIVVNRAPDSNAVLGWLRPRVGKTYFDLEDADLLTLLPQIGAWYRVQVMNPYKLKGTKITGEIEHSLPLPDLVSELDSIEVNRVRLRLQGDTIFVLPLQ